jgi:hypothetical protein
MGWVHRNRRFGTWLALAALTLQLVVSFGHVHLESCPLASPSASVANAKTAAWQPCPTQHSSNNADDYCAICAAIQLASASFLPNAPQVPMPFACRTVEHLSCGAFVFIARQRTAFQSRAPPLA